MITMLKTNGKSKQHVRTHGYCKQRGGNFKNQKEMLEIKNTVIWK